MARQPDSQPDCVCTDPATLLLAELVEDGHDQVEVSHLLWGDPTRASHATTVAFAGRATRLWVRRSFTAAFPWLRLPGGPA